MKRSEYYQVIGCLVDVGRKDLAVSLAGKPPPLGVVMPKIKARLFDKNKKEIGYCMDTPNSIAKAFMEWPKAMFVQEWPYDYPLEHRKKYTSRMKSWNKVPSLLVKS